MSRTVLATVAVALLCVTAGCAGLVSDGNATETDGTGPGAATTPTSGPAEVVDDGSPGESSTGIDGDFQAPSIQTAPNAQNYTALYDETISSVAEIRVETAQGGGQGSGFVYHSDGYVVTNQHVVANAEEVSVGFASGVWRNGTVLGTDVYTDLAVIQVDSMPDSAEPLPVAEANPEPGQPVAATGSPLGFQGSITHGIVSGTNRSMPVAGGFSIPDTVQTDAAINPGNSGGPLVSMNGAVVGVNRATAGDNIGFAISADVVREVVPSLIENGSYAHSFMGVGTVPLSPEVAAANDLNTTRGVLIGQVLQGGPADGVLQPSERETGPDGNAIPVGGDVIVAIEGQSIASHHDLARYLLFETHPGETIDVTVLRDGERVTETLTLGERPDPRGTGGV